MTNKIIQTFYISTGRKNAMFTLRCSRDTIHGTLAKVDANPDFYICNLAATEDKAIEKAREHVEAFRQRVGENNSFNIFFDDCWINKVRCGNNIVTYIGNKALGEKGTVVSFKGTVKEHQVYKGVKSTKINRPYL